MFISPLELFYLIYWLISKFVNLPISFDLLILSSLEIDLFAYNLVMFIEKICLIRKQDKIINYVLHTPKTWYSKSFS